MRLLSYPLTAFLLCAPLLCATENAKTVARLDDAAALFSEVMSAPDKSIPQDLLSKAACIVLVPGLKKGAFVVGGNTAGALPCAAMRADKDGDRLPQSGSKAVVSGCKPVSLRAT